MIRLLTREDGSHRLDFLRLACDLLPDGRCMAAVWLWDPDAGRLSLNRYFSPLCSDESGPLRWRRAEYHQGGATACDPRPATWKLSLESQPEIRSWCQELGLGAWEAAVPIITSPEKEQPGECLGFLQVVTAEPIARTVGRVIPHLAAGLAAAIVRSRERRQLQVLKMVQEEIDLTRSVEVYLLAAAQALQKITRAELCLVFRQERDLGMKAFTTWPDILRLGEYVARPGSLTHRIAQWKLVARLSDFQDKGERRRIFGTANYDVDLFNRVRQVLRDGELHAVDGRAGRRRRPRHRGDHAPEPAERPGPAIQPDRPGGPGDRLPAPGRRPARRGDLSGDATDVGDDPGRRAQGGESASSSSTCWRT